MRALLITLLLMISGLIGIMAQRSFEYQSRAGTVYARFNPLGLLDVIDPNLSLGVECRLNRPWAIAMDAAWVFTSAYAPESKRVSGIILRPAVRRYTGSRRNSFIEAELHYKQVTYHLEDWLGRDCVNDVPAYEQFMSFRLRKQVFGIQIKGGSIFPVTRNRRLSMEVNVGVGVRYRIESFVNEPQSCYSAFNNIVIPGLSGSRHWFPAFPLGLRFLYRMN